MVTEAKMSPKERSNYCKKENKCLVAQDDADGIMHLGMMRGGRVNARATLN